MKKQSLFLFLPDDCLSEIFAYLMYKDILSLSLTCSKFNNIIKDQNRDKLIWSNIIINEFPSLKSMCEIEFLKPLIKRFYFKLICYQFIKPRRYKMIRDKEITNNIDQFDKEEMEEIEINRLYYYLYRIIHKSFLTKGNHNRNDDRERLFNGANIPTVLGLTSLLELVNKRPIILTRHDLEYGYSYCFPDDIAIEKVCKNGDIDILRYCLKKEIFYMQENFLDIAAEYNQFECFKFIYINFIKYKKLSDKIKRWCIEYACKNNNKEFVDYCIKELCCDITYFCLRGAIKSESLDMIKYILSKNDKLFFTENFLIDNLKNVKIITNLLTGNDDKPFLYQTKTIPISATWCSIGIADYKIGECSELKPYEITQEIVNNFFFDEYGIHRHDEFIEFIINEYPQYLTMKHLAYSFSYFNLKAFELIKTIIPANDEFIYYLTNSPTKEISLSQTEQILDYIKNEHIL